MPTNTPLCKTMELPPPLSSDSESEEERAKGDEDEKAFKDVTEDKECIFSLTILNGYSFRHLFEFSKRVFREMPLIFSRSGITSATCSSNRQIVVNAILRREDIPFFHVNPRLVNMPATQETEWYHVVNIDTVEMFESVRNIVKKDSVKLCQYADSPRTLEIVIFGSKMHRQTISTRPYTPVSYYIADEIKRPTACPNLSVSIAKFCGCLSRLLRSKTGKYNFRVYSNGVSFTSVSDAAFSVSFKDLGNGHGGTAPFDTEPLVTTIVTSQLMTALAKIANFSRDGAIKFYCAGTNVVRVEAPIGAYGTLRFFISSVAVAQVSNT